MLLGLCEPGIRRPSTAYARCSSQDESGVYCGDDTGRRQIAFPAMAVGRDRIA